MKIVPRVTIFSPDDSPDRISTIPSLVRPTRTSRNPSV
jgi:hypothetical protein